MTRFPVGAVSSDTRSWWLAERNKIYNLAGFKRAFLGAFLPTDYLTEVEEQLKDMIQGPDQYIRDFAYDYRALCLKWKADLPEEEVVRRILNNCNPSLAGSLRGAVHTVEQLVKVGSMVERDLNSKRDYWAKINQLKVSEKGKKNQTARHVSVPKALSGQTQHLALVQSATPPLLRVVLKVHGVQVEAILDTGSTFTLMQRQVWEALAKPGELMKKHFNRNFVLADGKVQTSEGRVPSLGGQLWSQQEEKVVNVYMALPLDSEVLKPLNGLGLSIKDEVMQNNPEEIQQLLQAWPSLCSDKLGRTNPATHQIITTDVIPVRCKAYRVSPLKKEIIREEIEKMLQDGIIEPSQSPWASPVVLVPKPDQSLRFCVDYRCLNAKTPQDAYPMPLVHDILESMHGAQYFSTLDLKSGYWQVEVEKDSREKTAFITPFGLYHFLTMPFGLKNAGATFQRLMERTELRFLGHVVSGKGVEVDPEKTAAINNYPIPCDLPSLQRFLGLIGWYHKFIPHLSELAAPLYKLQKKKVAWTWTEECQQSVEKLKAALQQAPVLAQPDLQRPFQVQTDASATGLGAVLTQKIDNKEFVIAYASRCLRGAELNYSTPEKECLAVVWAVEKWHHYLEGVPFVVYTDHAALSWAFNVPKTTSRLTRWTLRLQRFQFQVQYRKERMNVVPDALSRSSQEQAMVAVCVDKRTSIGNFELPTSLAEIAEAQNRTST
ncbi:Retrovirus-related Pol polyprotein from transposon 17.6 [Labeo rohita]|uniref:Retrovirus-related Pol polyprotein from transposon 17.6 n=1 Tax=Labeo rohita TaxID=84645 RepID=A0ABQ8L525_LABRO|nr:Retrovirus-related Pol polyprotein from transposon 17.6 [Labeo rohita]